MKYPQLVSTRAVNAISDWLVSRLEQLGVEAPLIYSRLLLSLLHSSVQINDPIEFNNLETYLTNRKGHKRNHNYHPTDANSLKKLTAIQCLTEAVSSDQDISQIEVLVDELCDKLHDIEKQLDSDDKEYQTIGQILNFITVVGSVADTGASTSNYFSSQQSAISEAARNFCFVTTATASSTNLAEENRKSILEGNKNCINLNLFTKHRNNKSNKGRIIINLNEIEDPRKRYYNAFPALTKEMEDSFRNSNRYTKALTWPNDKTTSFINQINRTDTTTFNNNNNNNSNISNINSKNNINTVNNHLNSINFKNQNEMYIRNNNNFNSNNNMNTAGVKRKPKRRRNQAMLKGRASTNCQRKNSFSGNCSPTWDTDFEGSWEMGRDLIKEFIVKENNRNRSTSESAAYNMDNIIANNNNNSISKLNNNNNIIDEELKYEKHSKLFDRNINDENGCCFFMPKNHQNNESFCADSIEHGNSLNSNMDNLVFKCSVSSEIVQDEVTSAFQSLSNTNQLNSNNLQISTGEQCNLLLSDEGYSTHENLTSLSELDTSGVENADINPRNFNREHYMTSSQRRLYERDGYDNNDDSSMSLCSNIEQQQYDFAQFKAKFNSSVEALWKDNSGDQNENSNFSTYSEELKSLPERQNLNNFWMNYYNHRYEPNQFEADEGKVFEDSNQRDFLSMPDQIKVTSKSKPTASIYLQDSIWSDSLKNYDDDDSFFANVKKSAHLADLKVEVGSNQYENVENYPQDISKCQQGINEITLDEHSVSSNPIGNANSYANFNYDVREVLLNNPSFYNYLQKNFEVLSLAQHSPSNQNYDEELAAIQDQQFEHLNENSVYHQPNLYKNSQIETNYVSPKVSLENHSKSSAFTDYSIIKKHIIDHNLPTNIPKLSFNNSIVPDSYAPTYSEDENLLTSDRTHFRPIKQTYADGYVFDICNFLDEIEYDRSESGFLCYDGERYMEYTKLEGVIRRNDEDQNAKNNRANNERDEKFILKFRVINKNEKCCQTDPPSPQESFFKHFMDLPTFNMGNLNRYAEQSFPQQNFFGQFISESESENTSNYYVEEENRSSTSNEEYQKFDGSFIYDSSSNTNCSNIESAKAAAAVIMAAVANNNQFNLNKKLQNWSMMDVRKKCNANYGDGVCDSKMNNNDIHTLWGTCAACNSNQDSESLPANRLLKDELKVEGDEIMSHLKYMQDLYIGSDWEEGTCSSSGADSDNFVSDTVETDCENDQISEKCSMNGIKRPNKNPECIREKNFFAKNTEINNNNDFANPTLEDDMQQTDLYYNVTKLIADLLKPENAKSLANALGEAAIQAANVQAQINNNLNIETSDGYKNFEQQLKIENYCDGAGGIWSNNDENCIWKNNELKPLDNYLTKFNSINNFSKNQADTNDLSGKLGWEHSNLADIWNQESESDSLNRFDNQNSMFKNENRKTENLRAPEHLFQFRHNVESSNDDFVDRLGKDIINMTQNDISIGNTERNQYDIENVVPMPKETATRTICNGSVNLDKSKQNNRSDRKRRHSASQMITSCRGNFNINSKQSQEPDFVDPFVTIQSSMILNKENSKFRTENTDDNSCHTNNNQTSLTGVSSDFKNRTTTSNATTINSIHGKRRENLKFEISNNCRNFLNNCQNIIGGGDSKHKINNKHINFYENLFIDGHQIALMKTNAKDMLIKTNLNDYVYNNDNLNNNIAYMHNNDENDESKVTSTTTETTESSSGGDRIAACNFLSYQEAKNFESNDSSYWHKENDYLDYDFKNLNSITGISPSSILKHVALVSRPLTR